MIRILHVAQPTTGGVGHYVAGLVEDQLARGWDVAVACPTAGPLAERAGQAGATYVPWAATRKPGRAVAGETRSLKRIVADTAPQVVHLHSSKAGLAGRLALRGRPATLFQPHGWSWLAVPEPVASAARAWEQWAARWARQVICVSEAERAAGARAGVHARWVVVPTGTDLRRFHARPPDKRLDARRRLGVGVSPLAVCVGRLSKAKGQDLLAAAWPRVRVAVPDAQLALVGTGELEPAVRRVAGPGVELLGDRTDVAEWYAAADVVVVPSRWDALSMALVEAAASGCCIVATDVPGVREVLGDGERGAVVPPGDEAALVDATVRRLTDPALARSEGAAAGAFAATRFDRDRTYADLARITEQAATLLVPE